MGDQVTLDSVLHNSYAEHVLGGKSLPSNYNIFITMQQAVSGGNISCNISRAVSRLKTLYFSFYGGDPTAGQPGIADDAAAAAAKTTGPYLVKKECNCLYHPMLGTYDFNKELEYQVQIGS